MHILAGRVRARSDAVARSPRGESRSWQIGPKIRIGGTVGKIGEGIKHAVPSVGSMIGGAMIPGGNVIGSAINHSVGEDFKKGAAWTPVAIAGAKLLDSGNSNGGTQTPGSGDPGGGPPSGGTPPGGGSWTDWFKKPENWVKLVEAGVTGFASYEAFKEGQKNSANSDALMHEGIDMAKQDYASRGQYRDAAQQHLLNPTRPNLSSMFADPGNPYKNANRVPSVGPSFSGAPQSGGPNTVLGRPATPDQAQNAYDAAKGVVDSGVGGLHSVIGAINRSGGPPPPPAPPPAPNMGPAGMRPIQPPPVPYDPLRARTGVPVVGRM